ncbi:uncharacterized protein Bfra_010756 [Botrytis fragariae]|uniref:Uncharacterized protein n=1 Tax=Botrytis fragariae TaxID=1964551 RepID=A0A8H6ALA1_9HELO|nr:uncharacterized protein Bfra_010756 [Botrytis fragariae]KAF5869562.1 hypothetical protein Bfra_010756 [Botrytis fragariae]
MKLIPYVRLGGDGITLCRGANPPISCKLMKLGDASVDKCHNYGSSDYVAGLELGSYSDATQS